MVPVACFLLFFVLEKLVRKYSRNWTGQTSKSITFCGEQEVQRGDGEACQGSHTPLGAGGPCPTPRQGVGPLATASASPSPISIPQCRNPKYPINIPRNLP